MPFNRREFLKRSGFAASGFYLSTGASWAMPQTPQRTGSGKRITILGAGLAGLAAGWELKHAGHAVTILEAQLHPGGRVHTIREGLSDDMETVIVKSWVNHPWQKGAYVVYHPGQQEWYPAIRRREGRIWFAGEHTSPWPGWMQGAIASGIKAARDINVEPGNPA